MKPTTKILKEARELIARPHGWVKGQSKTGVHTKKGLVTAYCATGALREVGAVIEHGVVRRYLPGHQKARRLLREELPMGIYNVESFNDESYTRKKDVLALYDRAIEKSQA